MKVFLNSVPTVPPLGLDALTLQKIRNPRTWGFFYRKIGYVKFGDVTFSDPSSVRTLRDAYRRDRLNAEVAFAIADDQGRSIYESYVDFVTYSSRPGRAFCSFRDSNPVTTLEASFTSAFSVPATQTISLPGQPITAESAYVLSRPTVTRPVSGPVAHALPLMRKDDKDQSIAGTLLSVLQPLSFEPIYKNETGKPVTIQISGVVDVDFTTDVSFSASLGYRLLKDNRVVGSAPFSTFAIESGSHIVTGVDTVITVPHDTSVAIGWMSASSNAAFTATYRPTTSLGIQEPVSLPETTCFGMYAHDLLKELALRCGPSFGFRSDFFRVGDGRSVFLTNGANLRGVNRPFKIDFAWLFDQLDRFFNLEKTLDGPDRQTLRLEPKVTMLHEAGTTILPSITDVRYKVNTQFVASEVLTGFGTWKSNGLTSAIEPNGSRSYRTDNSTFRNTIDLRSALIASGSLIEEIRRKQFLAETTGSGKEETHDDDLFIIIVDQNGRATTSPNYNAELCPENGLRNWLPFLTYCGNLTLETVQGALAPNESTTFAPAPPLIGDQIATVTVSLSMLEYERLNDWIEFHDGEQTCTGLLMEASWSQTADGPVATLILAC
ncbi:hypothetical protein GCM10027347_44730 [Larkinella harenae]